MDHPHAEARLPASPWGISPDPPTWERSNSAIAVLSSLGFSENPRGKMRPLQTMARPMTISAIPRASIFRPPKRLLMKCEQVQTNGSGQSVRNPTERRFCARTVGIGTLSAAPRRAPDATRATRKRRRHQAGSAERGVAIPGAGDYVRVWRSRELERSGKLGCTDTLSTELTGSTTPAAVILFVACRLRRRWSELGGWYAAQMADTRLHPLDCACWN